MSLLISESSKKYFSYEKLYSLLIEIPTQELGGEYNLKKGFYIDLHLSHYDYKEDRPYTILNTKTLCDSTDKCVVWHSHPFNSDDLNNFPSIEDIDAVRLSPLSVHLLMVDKGIYILSSIQQYISIDNIIHLYMELQPECIDKWNYKSIQKNFLNNKLSNTSDMRKYGIYIHFIRRDKVTVKLLNQKINNAFGYKE